jgi:murein DD-endopeptidase MepM/ murein hydrolase activator NlpD
MPIARTVVRNQRSRIYDKFGSGQFGVTRDHHSRLHQGLDMVASRRERIFSPIDGTVVREAIPYPKDPSMRGVIIKGSGEWAGYEIKIFYAEGLVTGGVKAGQHIAFAQDLGRKYPGITNHVHVEVRRSGAVVSPQDIFAQCF